MKKLLFILICGLFAFNSHAQVNRYKFSQSANPFDTLTTGSVLGTDSTLAGTFFVVDTAGNTAGSTTVNSGIGLPIGFNFVYNDSTYTLFGVNVDGWISFGKDSVDMNSSSVKAPIDATSAAPAVLQNRVSALGNTLVGQPGSQLSYATLGLAPFRVLVVEWKHFGRNLTNGDNINFQIRLYETTNVVEFIYGNINITTGVSAAEVGIRGMTNADYLNRTTADHWNATSAGVANNSTCALASYSFPDSSLTFNYTPPFHTDAGVTAINYPVSPFLAPATSKIAVAFRNYGTDTLKADSIGWSVNGVLQAPSFWSGKLAYNTTNASDTIGSYNFATAGTYVIKAWSYKPNDTTDQNNVNDTSQVTIYVGGYASLPFIENFDGTWINFQNTRDVPSVYWINTPVTGNNSWRRDDDTLSASWTKGNKGVYSPEGANSTAHSARFHSAGTTAGSVGTLDAHINFTTVGTKMLNFYYHNTGGDDSLALYISTNGGTTWKFINKYFTVSSWTLFQVNLGSSTSANTILRFKATDDATDASDIGIDNVQVYILQPVSLAAVAWVSPTTSCGMTGTEPVTIKFANTGTSKVPPPITVKYSTNDGFTSVTESYTDTVPVGDTVSYTFNTTADFSVPGIYHCILEAHKVGYPFVYNDTLSSFVTSLAELSGNPFTDSLEKGNMHYTLLSAKNSLVALDSLVGNQKTHGFYCIGDSAGTWTTNGVNTTPHEAFSYADHIAKISTCNIDASSYTAGNLYLKLDLKQISSPSNLLSYFVVLVNRTHGIDTISDITGTKYLNPITTHDPYSHKIFNLSAYVDSTFTLEFVSACKFKTDSVCIDNITLSAKPVINLHDTTFCPGGILNAGASPAGYSYLYNWSTLLHPATIATTQSIAADSAATYIVTVDNGFGVTASDTIVVTTYPVPADLIARYDTGCAPLNLNAGIGYSSYTWSTGATTISLNADTSGTYWVDVVNSNGCKTRDSASVHIIPLATAFAGPTPQTVCYLDSLNILGDSAENYISIKWRTSGDGHFNNTTILHPKYMVGSTDISSHTVTLKLTAYSQCDSVSSTIAVTVTTAPSVSVGHNDTICKGSNVQLLATGGTTYSWSPSTGLSSTTIANPLADPTKTTTYIVTGSSSCGSATDNITVTVDTIVDPNLGANDSLCANASIVLDAGAGYASYLWSTGATTETITVDSAGIGMITRKFKVIVSKGACTAVDSISITFRKISPPNLGPSDTLCANGSKILDAGVGYNSYLWSTGATTEKLTVDSSGIGIGTKKFKVIVTKGTCSTADSIDITFRVCTGINEYSNNNASIKIFPNPTTGMTNIMVNGIDGNAVLNIYSLLGQSVFTKNLNGNLKTELDLTNLTKGIYLVKISNENANILRKLIIQ